MAAVFVVLAGGANALAVIHYTVWTVSKASTNSTCSSITIPPVTTCNTIGSAVSAAHAFDTILVGPGTYNEYVTINKPLSLLGAQAGNDARGDRHGPESIVDGSGTGYPTITIEATSSVVIDGFTIQCGIAATSPLYPAGIYLAGANVQIVNNIIQNNSMGIYAIASAGIIIERNLFRNNNAGTGIYLGYGIFATPFAVSSIGDNEFTGNLAAAMYLGCGASAITNNTSDKDGSFVVFISPSECVFKHNQGKNFGAKGVKPVVVPSGTPPTTNADAAVDIALGGEGLVISDNDLEGGESTIYNGIAFTIALGDGESTYATVQNNKVSRFPHNGIVAEADPTNGDGTLYLSPIVGNEVRDNGNDGILIQEATSGPNFQNSLFDNEAEGNHLYDCEDDTGPSGPPGTLGTNNYWFNNIGNMSSPTGLCTPGRSH
jgi:parallel beta-helix repeat protein